MTEFDVAEALRYLGAGRNPPEELRKRAADTAEKLTRSVRPRWTWKAFTLERRREGQDAALPARSLFFLPGREDAVLTMEGKTADTMLSACGAAVLLACTLGAGFDALLRAAQTRDMSEAVILDACGSAWVEAACDGAEREIASRFPGLYRTDRFSPGYGDLPLSLQRELCALLDTPRRLGVHVTDSFLLNPAKSVTAVIGLSDRPQMARVRGCAHCAVRESCSLRKGGKSCAI